MGRLALALLLVSALHTAVVAQNVPNTIGYQGRLTTSTGQPVADGTHSVVFRIYNVPDGPNAPLFTSAAVNVTTHGGVFATSIPDVPADSLGPDNRWLEIVVAGETLSPRTELASVPFALHADLLDGLDSTAFLQSIPVPLALSGTASLGGSIISGTNDSTNNGSTGVFGRASSTVSAGTIGVKGQSDAQGGTGVFGTATATTGTGYGGSFRTEASLGIGVMGLAGASLGSAAGVYGASTAPQGFGVAGAALNTTTADATYGGHFSSHSTNGRGVFGRAYSLTGANFGGYFESASSTGTGAFGQGTTGVRGESASTSGIGVYGYVSQTTGLTKAILGECLSPGGYAGYFQGRGFFSSNVGIGTPPSHPLHIAAAEPVIILQDTGSASQQSGYLGFWNNNPTETAWVGFGTPGSPHFSVVNARSGGNIILSPFSGNVGINTSAPTFKLHVNGSVAGVGAYNNLSDLRVKRDIRPIKSALEKVESLHGVSFDWRRAENPGVDFPKGRQIGVIGQEVAKVLPECVTRDGEGYISVAYGSLVPVLIEAIKEQQRDLDAMRADNRRLQDRLREVEALKAQVAELVGALKELPTTDSMAARPR